MNPLVADKARERVNFWIPKALSKRVKWAEKEFDFSRSDLFRQAIIEFITKLEQDAIDREVEETCKFYRTKDQQLAKEWRAAEGPI